MSLTWIISPLDNSFDKANFDCENPRGIETILYEYIYRARTLLNIFLNFANSRIFVLRLKATIMTILENLILIAQMDNPQDYQSRITPIPL